jgi:hypothetical protein
MLSNRTYQTYLNIINSIYNHYSALVLMTVLSKFNKVYEIELTLFVLQQKVVQGKYKREGNTNIGALNSGFFVRKISSQLGLTRVCFCGLINFTFVDYSTKNCAIPEIFILT